MTPRVRFAAGAAFIAFAALSIIGYLLFERVESVNDTTFGAAFVHGARDYREVALTFDDGPNPPYTEQILDVLRAEHVHATFFVVGRAVLAHPETVRAIVREGSVVGGHGWEHEHWTFEKQFALRTGELKTWQAIYKAIVFQRPRSAEFDPTLEHREAWFGNEFFVRPPFGQRGPDTFAIIEKERDETPVLWSESLSDDWTQPGVATIAERSTRDIQNGDIIVLHDGDRGRNCPKSDTTCSRAQEAPATREIIERLRSRGFAFVTIPELFAHAMKSPTCRIDRTLGRAIPLC